MANTAMSSIKLGQDRYSVCSKESTIVVKLGGLKEGDNWV